MHNFPTYNPDVSFLAQRFVTDAEMFPPFYKRGEDGTLIRQVPETFIRDFMNDSDAIGWTQELCGIPAKLVITVLRRSDVFKSADE